MQDNEQSLEVMRKESAAKIAQKQAKIDEVDRNIEMLKQSKRDRKKKHEYYKSVLDSQESGNQ